MIIGLLGNPNSGKTTLFNALTGSHQKVGNWPGVTVERRSGLCTLGDQTVEIVDLPGTYALQGSLEMCSLDERIVHEYLLSGEIDLLINVVDASHLERNLYLTVQLMEMGIPMVIALNMMDVARAGKIVLDLPRLSAKLKCPVVPLESHKEKGIEALKRALSLVSRTHGADALPAFYPEEIQKTVRALSLELKKQDRKPSKHTAYRALKLLEGEEDGAMQAEDLKQKIKAYRAHLHHALGEEVDVAIADLRYGFVHDIEQEIQKKPDLQVQSPTERVDQVILNRWLGLPLFLMVMYALFWFSINVGGAFQDFFNITSDLLFVQTPLYFLQKLGTASWILAFVGSLGRGINTTLTFVPILSAMFFALSFLESSGYMVRAAFVMDRVMRFLGLPGQSFVPMIVGFGCNVPAIMATRTLGNVRDRVLTALMIPFMSCSARLVIFAVFVAAFFPVGGQNVVFSLYMVGILMAILTGFILRKTLLQGSPTPWIMELPPYHWPVGRVLCMQTYLRLKHFLWRAGKTIVLVCVLIDFLNRLTLQGAVAFDGSANSVLSFLGQKLTPLFAPMGIAPDNWPATVGLMMGALAKEVVIATLNTLYGGVASGIVEPGLHLIATLKSAGMSILNNLASLPETLIHPLATGAPSEVSARVYGEMYARFGGAHAAFSYLLFVLLYVPCAATMAVIRRELSGFWMWFSILWSMGLAYGSAVFYYQWVTFESDPMRSLSWMIGIALVYLGVILTLRFMPMSSVLGTSQKQDLGVSS